MDNRIPVRLTLVSASPRRSELLAEAGFHFDVIPSCVSESWHDRDPVELALRNAEKKVRRSDHFRSRDRLLIGADTVVAIDSRIFGKPAGRESARRMLETLSDRAHSVITGVCLSGPAADARTPNVLVASAAVSCIMFHPIMRADLKEYLSTNEWSGKAGAYAIQGAAARFVRELSGDYDNVVGLPVRLVNVLLTRHFGHCRLQS